MIHQTVTRLYDLHEEAVRAVHELEADGLPATDISLLGSYGDSITAATLPSMRLRIEAAEEHAATGASIGTLIGGGAGLMAGLGILAIPGIGPIVAAGWLVAMVTGAGIGAVLGGGGAGLVGLLAETNASDDDVWLYAEAIRRGGTVVSVRTTEPKLEAVEAVLDRHGPVDLDARRMAYRTEGWTHPAGPPPA